ncbi:Nif3-like dinuclear metal center hexameric protein [Leptobacterium sp. I13]|uniref:Nif3-like dinuclear metal center hexameric protein n=1 Tax=Leptobacterium meishanense TaxID=3128904 RepID=UPI0030ED49FE
MIVQDVINHIEELAPLAYAEDFDNVGLLIGERNTKITSILVTLDTLECVIDEAIEKKCNLIVSFHPIIFSGLKQLNGSTYVERTVIKAIQNNIAIYAAHTALDNTFNGVNAKLCDVLGIRKRHILIPQQNTIKKLITFVPPKHANSVREALFNAGAGTIGNYDNCSFNTDGTGTYKGNEHSNPVIGERGKFEQEPETQIGVIYPKHLEKNILNALFDSHPYEEVAYECYALENTNQHIGMGMIGELDDAMDEHVFLTMLKEKLNLTCIRHSELISKKVKKVAVLGGSGAFAIEHAKKANADVFITSDIKYHQFFQAENSLLLIDAGHYETEQFTKNLLVDYLKEKIHNFAIVLSECNTNPIKYF